MQPAKIAVAVVCFGAAGAMLLLRGVDAPSDPIPNTPESSLLWMCRDCRHQFELTALAMNDAIAKSGQQSTIECPECHLQDAWRACRCDVHDRVYFVIDVPGEPGVCVKCDPIKARENLEQPAQEATKKPAESFDEAIRVVTVPTT